MYLLFTLYHFITLSLETVEPILNQGQGDFSAGETNVQFFHRLTVRGVLPTE